MPLTGKGQAKVMIEKSKAPLMYCKAKTNNNQSIATGGVYGPPTQGLLAFAYYRKDCMMKSVIFPVLEAVR